MVYFVQRKNGDIKIGYTTQFYNRRARIKSDHGKLKTLYTIDSGSLWLEKMLHNEFSHLSKGGEWFKDDPGIRAIIDLLKISRPFCHPIANTKEDYQTALNRVNLSYG